MTGSWYTVICAECGDRLQIGITKKEIHSVCSRCQGLADERLREALEAVEADRQRLRR